MDIDSVVRDFYEYEKLGTMKKVGRVINMRNPEGHEDYVLSCVYLRKLDDAVDLSTTPDSAEQILSREKDMLEGLILGDKPDYTEDFDGIVEGIRIKYGKDMIKHFIGFIESYMTDNDMIKNGAPIDRDTLYIRHTKASLPAFKIISQIGYGRELKYSEGFKELMITWLLYDALKDIKEDIEQGIILFPKEELDDNGVEFIPGKYTTGNLERVFNNTKQKVSRDMFKYMKSVDDTNLPFTERKLLQAYFISRSMKTKKIEFPTRMMYQKNRLKDLSKR